MLFSSITSREPSSRRRIDILMRLSGRVLAMELPHSTTIMLSGLMRFSSKSSRIRPGSGMR